MKARRTSWLFALLTFACVPAHAIPSYFEITGVIDTDVWVPVHGIDKGTTFTGKLTFDPEMLVREIREIYSGGWSYEFEIAGYTFRDGGTYGTLAGGFTSTGISFNDETPITLGAHARDYADLISFSLTGPIGPELDLAQATGGTFGLLMVRDLFPGDMQYTDVVGHITTIRSVPEPATLGLFSLGVIGAVGIRRRRRR